MCRPVSLQAENRLKLPQGTECICSPHSARLPVGFGGRRTPGSREGSWQRRQLVSPSRAWENQLPPGHQGLSRLCRAASRPLLCPQRAVMEAVRVPASSRGPANLRKPWGVPCCRRGGVCVLGRQLLLVALGWGQLLHPAPRSAARSQHGHPVPLSLARVPPVSQRLLVPRSRVLSLCQGTSQAALDAALPAGCLAEPLCLPCVAAEATGRMQEVQGPSLCCLVCLQRAEVLVAPGLMLVLGISLLSGSWRCWGSSLCRETKRDQTLKALKMSSSFRSAVGVWVAGVAARLVARWCREVPAGAQLFGDRYTRLEDAAPHRAAHRGPVDCSCRSRLALQGKLQRLASPVLWDWRCLPPPMVVARTGES